MNVLPHVMERTILIQASREIVFSFFTDSARWETWWGTGSTIEARPGGELKIRHSNGFVSTGNVVELVPLQRFVFTFSLQTNPPTPPESSRVTIRLADEGEGTRVLLRHELASETVRDLMEQGWRFHLSLFANAVANHVHSNLPELVDEWFGLWVDKDAASRSGTLARIATPGVTFHDRYSALEGALEVEKHVGASQRFMPGLRMERRGDVRHCLGTALADWIALGPDGAERMRGTNVFVLGGHGKIVAVTGIASQT